jgi:hypothetical protein
MGRDHIQHGRLQASTAVGLAALLAAGSACAQADNTPTFRWSGFATLGLTHHDNDTAGVIASFAQRSPARAGLSGNLDTVGGLQLDARLGDATGVTLQGVARAGDDFKPLLRMAYVRQQLGADAAVRLGRIRSPLYLDSDVSEIGFAVLPVRPSMPVYGHAANYAPHIDGGDIQWRRSFGSAGVLVQAYAGQNKGRQVFHNLSPVEEARFTLKGIAGIALSVGLPQVTFRASHTEIDSFTMRSPTLDGLNAGIEQVAGGLQAISANPLLPAPARAALGAQAQGVLALRNPFDARPRYTSLGVDSTVGPWRATAELVDFTGRKAMVGRYRGHQWTVGYTWGSVTPYVGSSKNTRRSPPIDTRVLAATGLSPALDGAITQLKTALDGAATFADLTTQAHTAGLRWDVREDAAIKLQFDRLTTPSSLVPGVLAVPRLPWNNRVNLFSVSLNLVF